MPSGAIACSDLAEAAGEAQADQTEAKQGEHAGFRYAVGRGRAVRLAASRCGVDVQVGIQDYVLVVGGHEGKRVVARGGQGLAVGYPARVAGGANRDAKTMDGGKDRRGKQGQTPMAFLCTKPLFALLGTHVNIPPLRKPEGNRMPSLGRLHFATMEEIMRGVTAMHQFNAVIERCPQTGLFVGYVPGFPGAHAQGETLDELRRDMLEVIEMLLEDGEPCLEAEFVGVQTLAVA